MYKDISLVICLLLLFSAQSKGQECEWINNSSDGRINEARSLTVDNDNDIVVLINYTILGNTLTAPCAGYSQSNFREAIVKYDAYGKTKWVSKIDGTKCALQDIRHDKNNNYFITGSAQKVDLGNGVSLPTDSTIYFFIAKYNSLGQPLWIRKVYHHVSPANNIFSCSNAPRPKIAVDAENSPVITFQFNGVVKFSGTTDSLSGFPNQSASYIASSIGILKYDSSGNYRWAKTLGGGPKSSSNTNSPIDIGADSSSYIYLFCDINDTLYNNQQVFGKSIIKLSPSGTFVRSYSFNNPTAGFGLGSYDPGGIAVYPDGRFAITGSLKNTINFGNGISLTRTTSLLGTYVAFFDAYFAPKWARQETNGGGNGANPYMIPAGGIYVKNNHIYVGGTMSVASAYFGGSYLNALTSSSFFIAKIDTANNVLWAFADSTGTIAISNIYDISVDNFGNALIAGYFRGALDFFGEKARSLQPANIDAFVAKLTDMTITRGYVSPGPYCAGDSIEIPFTVTGKFNTGNEFIAQLSDSAGFFEGGETELGRLKDTVEGIVKGALPLFNVATNNKYRIRIISTTPQVQSFYRRDTLRLLIYSKDTANAGRDTLLCKEQQIRLGTTGGSKWQWWPHKGFVNSADTNNRQPLVVADSTIEYRIIISDSSGCGVTDTDYVVINVRPPLELNITDTVVFCKGRTTTVKAIGTGGDTSNYNYKWSLAVNNTVFSTDAEINVSPDSATKYKVILGDNCSKNDTAFVVVIPDGSLLLPKLTDTTICLGNTVTLNAAAITCDSAAVKYVWDNGLGNGSVKNISPIITTTYKLVAYDTINNSRDSSFITVTVRPPLQLSINNDTTICSGNSIQLVSKASGGLQNQHKIKWFSGTTPLPDTTFAITVTPIKTTTYTAILADDCSTVADTATVTITVLDSLKLTVSSDTVICVGGQAELKAIPNGGLSSAYKVKWIDDVGFWTDSNYTTTVTPSLSTNYTAILTDGCTPISDSGKIKVTVLPSLTLSLTPDTTICQQGSALLKATPSGGYTAGYKIRWKANGTPIADTLFLLSVAPTITTVYTAILTDNCTLIPDSQQARVTVRPPLTVKISGPDTVCEGKPLNLVATATGGNNITHALAWSAEGTSWTSNQNPVTHVSLVNTKYYVSLSDNCSPVVSDSFVVAVMPSPKADFDIGPIEGCAPLQVIFTDNSVNNDTILNSWKRSKTTTATSVASYALPFYKNSNEVFSLVVSNAWGCKDSISRLETIKVHKLPRADFIVKPDIRETGKELLLVNNSSGGILFEWQTGDGTTFYHRRQKDTTYTYADSGYYTLLLKVTDENGCTDTATRVIRVFDAMFCVIPNAFTPNGDGNNDVFAPVCNGLSNYTLTIYSRWGQVLQECINCHWDANYADTPVPDGLYLYKIQVNAESGLKEIIYGQVNVLR